MGHLILGVVLQQVISHVVDWVLGLVFLLGECGQGLEHQGNHCLIQVGTDREGFETVLGGLTSKKNT